MEQLTKEQISQMDGEAIAANVVYIFDVKDNVEREQLSLRMALRAKELGISRDFQRLLKAANDADRKVANAYTAANAQTIAGVELKFDSNGKPSQTIENYLEILRNDPYFATFRFSLFSENPEITTGMKKRVWKNREDSKALGYIEKKYRLYDKERFKHALSVFEEERAYHPVREYIDALTWDGTPRIEKFMTTWMGCEDSSYTREVSRLIFAGGIHRIYDPGCKFDSVAVMIGTKQGEGKTALVRWLAIKDEWFGEVTETDGARGVESIKGKWICELGELLALVRSREVEAIKSYTTRQEDNYRVPYAARPEVYKRQCIFVGTTNKERFLTDKTGNRRWFPVRVNMDGYELFKREKECRAYIVQCWAEARAKYDDAFTSLAPDYTLLDIIREKQQAAEEDDWREGMIEAYLFDRSPGERVSAIQLYYEALKMSQYDKPTLNEQSTINLIMQKFPMWVRTQTYHDPKYGRHRGWVLDGTNPDDDLPF